MTLEEIMWEMGLQHDERNDPVKLPDELLARYFQKMVDRVFKILPLKQDGQETLPVYVEGLLIEMTGVDLLSNLSEQSYYVSLLGIVSYLSQYVAEMDEASVKREVFGAIKICNSLRRIYEGGAAK